MPPLIGITCSRIVGGAWGQYSTAHFMDYMYAEYSRAVQHFGGAPMIIPVAQTQETLESILKGIDGLILSGGPDIHPKHYGEQPVRGMGEVDDALDEMELAAAKLAYARNMPIFAICRGIQTLNVALGGTLIQNIPSQIQDCLLHSQKADKGQVQHTVRIEKESRLSHILKRREIWVNSKHHQAVKAVAPPLRIVAYAPDGVIEAVEDPQKAYTIGVQWHPEGTWEKDLYAKRLFRSFIQSASQ